MEVCSSFKKACTSVSTCVEASTQLWEIYSVVAVNTVVVVAAAAVGVLQLLLLLRRF